MLALDAYVARMLLLLRASIWLNLSAAFYGSEVEVKISKSQVEKAGRILSDPLRPYDEIALELDYAFEEYRKEHLEPLARPC